METRIRTPLRLPAEKQLTPLVPTKSSAASAPVKLTIRLDKDIHDKLRRIAFDKRCSISAIINQSITDMLSKGTFDD